ncbi:hypothetical protein OG884_28815 [Streptosporangium sp. NBC_01755]|uniref:hypothetical protein n=1 Tax=unclassified Streptosporangium TaxID=2632669 RepID=UPI002DDBF6E1|nr:MULTISPECIES: hypothetical protein [unclassified Streptosporangium]WSA23024.1 hypothetical protein OIE13_18770 [Streptosporangium sp. NBC_01810]WSC98832.1 hypothetical protein OG884_28815 [Streptosporangium sp. NBC_01755]
MEHHAGSDQPSVRHDPDFDERCPRSTGPESAYASARMPTGDLPRMFALVQELDEDDERGRASSPEVVAYGLALPDGTAATVSRNGYGFGRWTNAHRAAHRLGSDLVWLGESAV